MQPLFALVASPKLGLQQPVPVPGCSIREWGEGAFVGLLGFFLCELLAFGAFALVAERSILSVCLGAAGSEPSELLPGPTGSEEKSDLRGWEGKVPFEGT